MENIKNHSSRSSYFKKTVAIDASTYNRLIHNLVKHLFKMDLSAKTVNSLFFLKAR